MQNNQANNQATKPQLKEGTEVVLVEGQLRKIIHKEGQGQCPPKGSEVFALYRGTLETGEEFDSNQDRDSPFKFPLGQGRVIKGWDTGFASMKRGQQATLICSPEYAYGKRGSPPRIPANATLYFEVQLIDFQEKKKQKWELSDQEKIAEATKYKGQGNQSLKNGNFNQAIKKYNEGIQYVQGQIAQEAVKICHILRLNCAQAQIKSKKFSGAIQNCSKVLEKQPSNAKALYRRGVAYLQSQQFENARVDLQHLLKDEPNNIDAKNQLRNIQKAALAYKQKQKKVFGGMFSQGSIYQDAKKTQQVPKDKKTEQDIAPEQFNNQFNIEQIHDE